MDAEQWDSEQRNAQGMVRALSPLRIPRTKAGRRKLRLYACGCVRQVWHLLPDARLERTVVLAEQIAESDGPRSELQKEYAEVCQFGLGGFLPEEPGVIQRTAAAMAIHTLTQQANYAAASMDGFPVPLAGVSVGAKSGKQVLCSLLRCVFGNPFQKPAFNKKWRTETVAALAAGIYDLRAFDRLPILADALEDAGCDDPAMLAHLRADGPHCRGCWVLDLALGK